MVKSIKQKKHIKEYNQRYREKNREKIELNDKKFRKKHKSDKIGIKRKKQKIEWAKQNRAKINKSQSKYYWNNKERILEKGRIRALSYYHYKIKLLKEKKCCERCKSKEKLELHHKEYKNELNCLMLLCKKCHTKIHQRRFRK